MELERYFNTCLAELHFLANQNKLKKIGKIKSIDKSFLNCKNIDDYEIYKNYQTIYKGYYNKNKSSVFRKIYPYSITESILGDFINLKN